jgi:hypothetical protein
MFTELESGLNARSDKLLKAQGQAEGAKNAARKFSKSMEKMNDANLTPAQLKAVQAARQDRNAKLAERQNQRDLDFQKRKQERNARVAKYREQINDRRSVSPGLAMVSKPKEPAAKNTMSFDSFVNTKAKETTGSNMSFDSFVRGSDELDEVSLDEETSTITDMASNKPECGAQTKKATQGLFGDTFNRISPRKHSLFSSKKDRSKSPTITGMVSPPVAPPQRTSPAEAPTDPKPRVRGSPAIQGSPVTLNQHIILVTLEQEPGERIGLAIDSKVDNSSQDGKRLRLTIEDVLPDTIAARNGKIRIGDELESVNGTNVCDMELSDLARCFGEPTVQMMLIRTEPSPASAHRALKAAGVNISTQYRPDQQGISTTQSGEALHLNRSRSASDPPSPMKSISGDDRVTIDLRRPSADVTGRQAGAGAGAFAPANIAPRNLGRRKSSSTATAFLRQQFKQFMAGPQAAAPLRKSDESRTVDATAKTKSFSPQDDQDGHRLGYGVGQEHFSPQKEEGNVSLMNLMGEEVYEEFLHESVTVLLDDLRAAARANGHGTGGGDTATVLAPLLDKFAITVLGVELGVEQRALVAQVLGECAKVCPELYESHATAAGAGGTAGAAGADQVAKIFKPRLLDLASSLADGLRQGSIERGDSEARVTQSAAAETDSADSALRAVDEPAAAALPVSPPSGRERRRVELQHELTSFYQVHNPSKFGDGSLGKIVEYGIDNRAELHKMLVEQYGVGLEKEAVEER